MQKKIFPLFRFLSPPRHLSYEQSQKFKILQYGLLSAVLAALLIAMINLGMGAQNYALFLFACSVLSALGLVLNYRGKYRLAGWLLCLQIFTAILYTLIDGGGLSDSGIVAYPIFIIFTGFILGRRGLIGSLVCSIVSISGLYALSLNGVIVLNNGPSLDRVLVLSLLMLMAAAIVWVVLETWERSLAERGESLAHFRSLFEDSPVSLWEVDASALGKYLAHLRQKGSLDWSSYFNEHPDDVRKCVEMVDVKEVNRATLDLLDYPSKDEMLADIAQVFIASTYQAFLAAMLRIAEGTLCFEDETALKSRSGADVFVNLRVSVPEGYEDSWSSVQVSLTDISQRKRTETRLAESEERYRTLAQATFEGIVLSENGMIIDTNEQFAAMNRYTRQEVIGKNLLDFLVPEDQEWVKGVISRGEERISEYHGVRKDGSLFNAEAHGRVYEIGQKKVRITSIRDITERKQAEEAMRKSEEKFSKAFYSSPAVLAITTLEEGRFIDVNATFQKLFGFSHEETIGHTVDDLKIQAGPYQHGIGIEMVGGVHSQQDVEVEYRTRDRRLIQCSASYQEIFLEGERCIITTLIDVTEQKQSEERLRLQVARSNALARTAARLNAQLEMDKVLELICQEIVEAMRVPAASVLLYDAKRDACFLAAEHGFAHEFQERFQPLARTDLAEDQASQQKVVVLEFKTRGSNPNGQLFEDFNIRTLLATGMYHKEQFLGVVDVYCTHEQRSFSEDEMALLKALTDLGSQAIVNARLYREVSEGREHLRDVSQQLVEVQESERRVLALELHDELGQTLNGIKISLDMIPIVPEAATREQLLGRARAAIGGLIEKVRQMSLDLRPSLLDEMGLLPTLRWFFRGYEEQTQARVQFQWEGPERRLPPPLEITAYRIVQEALSNVIRHSSDQKCRRERAHGRGGPPAAHRRPGRRV